MSRQVYSTNELLALGKERLQGNSITFKGWKRRYPDSPSAHTILQRFGTWNNFLVQAGAEARTNGMRFTDKELLQVLARALEREGRVPTIQMWDAAYKPSSRTITKHFGSWENAWTRAGATPEQRTVFTEDKMLELLRQAYIENGRVISAAEWLKQGRRPDPSWFHKRLGSWTKAWKQALK